jgi:hypothetical protein
MKGITSNRLWALPFPPSPGDGEGEQEQLRVEEEERNSRPFRASSLAAWKRGGAPPRPPVLAGRRRSGWEAAADARRSIPRGSRGNPRSLGLGRRAPSAWSIRLYVDSGPCKQGSPPVEARIDLCYSRNVGLASPSLEILQGLTKNLS